MSSVAHAQHTQDHAKDRQRWRLIGCDTEPYKPNVETKFDNFQRQFCYLLTHELLGIPQIFPQLLQPKTGFLCQWCLMFCQNFEWCSKKKNFFITCGPQLAFSKSTMKTGEKKIENQWIKFWFNLSNMWKVLSYGLMRLVHSEPLHRSTILWGLTDQSNR